MPPQKVSPANPQPEEERIPEPEPSRRIEEKTLIEWTAPARPFKRRTKDFYISLMAISAIIGLILFVVEGFMPILLLISLVFLFYVMSTIEPENITYQVTNLGVRIADKRTGWDMMGRFWLTKRFGSELLIIEVFRIPGRIELVIDPAKKADIEKTMGQHLVHEEIPPSLLDKAANWLTRRLPDYD